MLSTFLYLIVEISVVPEPELSDLLKELTMTMRNRLCHCMT